MNRCRNAWAVVMVISLAATVAAAVNLMSIQIKKGQLRTTPSFLGKIVAELNYAEQVAVLEKKDAWINRMEQMVVSQNQIEQFLIDGKLSPKGGIK